MKKKLINKAVLFLSSVLFIHLNAQELNITPPSPYTFALMSSAYENDESFTGSAQATIPLLELRNNSLVEKVYLNYNSAGVKVDDISTVVGVSWAMINGGVVSRTVYGIPDEMAPSKRMLYDEATLKSYLQSDCNANDFIRNVLYQPTVYDSEKDVFRFKMGDISGSFILDENFNAKFIQNNYNVKVNLIKNGFIQNNNMQFDGFEIIDDKGIKYIFGGLDFIEYTGISITNPHPQISPTSYYLKEIKNINGDTIEFKYDNTDSEIIDISRVETRTRIYSNSSSDPNGSSYPEQRTESDIAQTQHIKNKKRLIQIKGKECNCKLEFTYENILSFGNQKYLSSIELSVNDINREKINLDYIFDTNTDRFFLKRVNFYKSQSFEKKYELEYYEPLKMPERLSKSQDLIGYYNGKNNTTLLAKPYTPFLPIEWVTETNSFGDRSPSFHHSLYGALKKIAYPTGGHTNFEYESPKAFNINVIDDTNTELTIRSTSNLMYKELILNDIPMDQNVDIKIRGGSNTASVSNAIFKVIDLDTNIVILEDHPFTYNRPLIPTPVSSLTLSLQKGKNYKITLEFDPVPALYNVFFTVTFDKLKTLVFSDYFGLRVKSKTEVSETSQANYRRYYYCPAEFYNKEEKFIKEYYRIEPAYSRNLIRRPNGDILNADSFTTETQNALFFSPNYTKKYEIVTCSLGGNSFENGGFEKHFYISNSVDTERIYPDSGNAPFAGSVTSGIGVFSETNNGLTNMFGHIYRSFTLPLNSNRADYDGNVIKIKKYNKKNGLIFLVQQENNSYNNDFRDVFVNLKSSILFDESLSTAICNGQSSLRIAHFYLTLYRWYNIHNKIKKSEIIDFNEGILLNQSYNSYDDYMNNQIPEGIIGIKNIKQFNYNSSNNNILSDINSYESTGNIVSTSYKYAHEKGNQLMIDKNMIGIPLETVVMEKQNASDPGKVVSKSEVIYPDQSTYPTPEAGNLLLPLSVKTYDILDPSTFTEVKYNKYDEKGNLVQYTTKEGKIVTIIWGYNKTQPIARIEGADYVSISDPHFDVDIIEASNKDANPPAYNLTAEASEQNLLEKLDLFRSHEALSCYLITTYSYDPLIGVRSITPPSGIREMYKYDSANRLERIENVEGKVLKTFQYHYKN